MVLLAHQSPLPIPLLLTPACIPTSLLLSPPLLPYTISQPDYPAIIRQLQKQIAVLTVQMGEGAERRVEGNVVVATEVIKLQIFDGVLSKICGFVAVCKLYIGMRLRESLVEE